MMTRRWYVPLVSALLLITANIQAQDKHEFSVLQAVEYAKKNNVQVKNALLAVKIQEETNRGLTASALPKLSATGNLTDYLKIPTQLLPGEFFQQPVGTFIPVKFGTKYTATGGFAFSQAIFDGEVFVGLKARKASIDFQVKNVEVTEERIKTNIYKIYYQLVVGRSQVGLLDANIDRLQKLQHDTREIYKNGFAEKLDVDKLEVQLVNLQTQKEKVLSDIDAGYYGLKFLMGMPMKETLALTDTISDDKLKDQLLDSAYAYNNRKEFQQLDLATKLQEYNVRRYKAGYYPTLNFAANHSYNAQRTEFDFLKKGGTWFPTTFIALNLKVPIFDGFSKNANLAKARLEFQQSQNNLDNIKLSIDNDVEKARLSYRTSIKAIDMQKRNMVLAEEVYNQTKKKYEIGTGSNTEITAAQTELVQAQTNYINALYDAIIARIDFMTAIGRLQ